MKKYDVTLLIHPEMTVYKNKANKKPIFTVASSLFNQDSSNETDLKFNLHTGTHLDFPFHMKIDGKTSLNFDMTTFIGRPTKVLDLSKVNSKITVADLQKHSIKEHDTIFLKTRNSFETEFNFEFVYLSSEAAQYLVDKNIFAVGIDALGIERDQPGHPTHHTLMNHNIWIIEGLSLKDVPEGEYRLIALPMKINHVEALPLSVILESIE